jgi:HEAT repeat protein
MRRTCCAVLALAFPIANLAALPHGGGLRNPPGFVPRPPGPVGEGAMKRPDSPLAPPQQDSPRPPGPRGQPGGPGPGAPQLPGGGPRTGGGIVLELDPTRWQDWWELNRDPYLRLRESLREAPVVTGSAEFFMGAGRVRGVDNLAPTEAQVRAEVGPALARLLAADPHRDLESAALIALAKVGQDRADFDLQPILAARLRDPDPEVRETAALALGLSGSAPARELLAGLARDDRAGRAAVDRGRVEDRVRAFAAYGLALSARAGGAAARRAAFAVFEGLLTGAGGFEPALDRDLRVAAILGLGLLLPESGESADRRSRERALELLRVEWDSDRGATEEVVRCHAATSIARLLEHVPGGSPLRAFHAARLAAVVADPQAGFDRRRAAALAVGGIARALDEEPRAAVREALQRAFGDAKDLQVRYFALIGLGRLADEGARTFLLEVLATGQRALERPWAALALGVWCRERPTEGVDPTIAAALRAQLDAVRNPESRAAFALGLGLCGDAASADELRALLADLVAQDEVAGHCCTALALLEDTAAIPELRELVRNSARRPQRQREAAVALGALGDHSAAELLVEQLRDGRPSLAQVASVAAGLGLVGDRRSIEPLLAIAADPEVPDLGRAFAVVALGQIVERGALPWGVPLAVDLNYRALVPTLIDGVRGVLDVH